MEEGRCNTPLTPNKQSTLNWEHGHRERDWTTRHRFFSHLLARAHPSAGCGGKGPSGGPKASAFGERHVASREAKPGNTGGSGGWCGPVTTDIVRMTHAFLCALLSAIVTALLRLCRIVTALLVLAHSHRAGGHNMKTFFF